MYKYMFFVYFYKNNNIQDYPEYSRLLTINIMVWSGILRCR